MDMIYLNVKDTLKILENLMKRTRTYPIECFEPTPDEPAAPEATIRLYRLKPIVKIVRRMGVKKFYQTPESFRSYYSQEDWVQDAMTLLLEQSEGYEFQKGTQHQVSFNRYILFRVNGRLTDIQRALFRKNPLLDEDLRQLTQSLNRELGREPKAAELAERSGCSVEKAREVLRTGWGERVLQTIDKASRLPDDDPAPDEQMIQAEGRKYLWDCIEDLDLRRKVLFVLHELDQVSFRELFEKFSDFLASHSPRTFQRHYDAEVFTPVKDCVQEQYA